MRGRRATSRCATSARREPGKASQARLAAAEWLAERQRNHTDRLGPGSDRRVRLKQNALAASPQGEREVRGLSEGRAGERTVESARREEHRPFDGKARGGRDRHLPEKRPERVGGATAFAKSDDPAFTRGQMTGGLNRPVARPMTDGVNIARHRDAVASSGSSQFVSTSVSPLITTRWLPRDRAAARLTAAPKDLSSGASMISWGRQVCFASRARAVSFHSGCAGSTTRTIEASGDDIIDERRPSGEASGQRRGQAPDSASSWIARSA